MSFVMGFGPYLDGWVPGYGPILGGGGAWVAGYGPILPDPPA